MITNDGCVILGDQLQSFRFENAKAKKRERHILLRTWGGLGDQICAEPTLRFAFKIFDKSDLYLGTYFPELFEHLPFKKVYNLNDCVPIPDRFFLLDTITTPEHLTWQFMSHALINAVDYCTLSALRSMMPVSMKEVSFPHIIPWNEIHQHSKIPENSVVVHPGKHWVSKTFPKDWWDAVLAEIIAGGGKPVLVGGALDDNRATVDVNASGCLDMRGKLPIKGTIALLKSAKVLLTNDSSPLHMAAGTDAWVGFIATCKHPDYIMHWRHGEWAWRMENLGLGGIWDLHHFCPNRMDELKAEFIEEATLRSWLPEPRKVAQWALNKLN